MGQLIRLCMMQKAFNFWDPLTRGCASGQRWGALPHSPVIGSDSALTIVPPNSDQSARGRDTPIHMCKDYQVDQVIQRTNVTCTVVYLTTQCVGLLTI